MQQVPQHQAPPPQALPPGAVQKPLSPNQLVPPPNPYQPQQLQSQHANIPVSGETFSSPPSSKPNSPPQPLTQNYLKPNNVIEKPSSPSIQPPLPDVSSPSKSNTSGLSY